MRYTCVQAVLEEIVCLRVNPTFVNNHVSVLAIWSFSSIERQALNIASLLTWYSNMYDKLDTTAMYTKKGDDYKFEVRWLCKPKTNLTTCDADNIHLIKNWYCNLQ